MKVGKVKTIVKAIELLNQPDSCKKDIIIWIDNVQTKLRLAHLVGEPNAILKLYWELIFLAFCYLVLREGLSEEDIDWKSNSNFIYWPSHIDLMMTYLEDFIGWDYMEKAIEEFIKNK